MKQKTVNGYAIHGADMSVPGVIAMMAGLRDVCAARSVARAEEFELRLREKLTAFRLTGSGRPSQVSVSLDQFISELKSALEYGAAPAGPSDADRDRIRFPIETLNQIYVASEQAVSVGSMTHISFMLGAESMAASAMRALRETDAHRERLARADVEQKRAAERERDAQAQAAAEIQAEQADVRERGRDQSRDRNHVRAHTMREGAAAA